jgi:hypothetical protein
MEICPDFLLLKTEKQDKKICEMRRKYDLDINKKKDGWRSF